MAGLTDFPFHPSRFATDTCKKCGKASNSAGRFQLNLGRTAGRIIHSGPKHLPGPDADCAMTRRQSRAWPGAGHHALARTAIRLAQCDLNHIFLHVLQTVSLRHKHGAGVLASTEKS